MKNLYIKSYLKQVYNRKQGAQNLPASELAKGTEIETKEHKDTIEDAVAQTQAGSPPAVKDVAEGITKDHLKEVDGKPYYTKGLIPMEAEFEKMPKVARNKLFHIILAAENDQNKSADFQKEIPVEVKQFINKDPERADRFFGAHKVQTPKHGPIREHIRNVLKERQPIDKDILQGLRAMQPYINIHTFTEPQQYGVLIDHMGEDNEQNWKTLIPTLSKKVVDYLKHNTIFSAKEFLTELVANSGNLSETISQDKLQ
jgi:hypothetical protein